MNCKIRECQVETQYIITVFHSINTFTRYLLCEKHMNWFTRRIRRISHCHYNIDKI